MQTPNEGVRNFRAAHRTGSWFTCDPPVMDTDQDWVVLVRDIVKYGTGLVMDGWTDCFGEDNDADRENYQDEQRYGMSFHAYRKGKVNYIVTDDVHFYLYTVGATLVAKELNIKSKADRIKLFRAFKYGEEYHGELP